MDRFIKYSELSGLQLAINVSALPVYADEAAATAGGLANYLMYRTPTGELRYKLPTGATNVFTQQFTGQFS